MSEREKAGLRGPVKQCTSESVSPSAEGAGEWRFSYTTEYDPDGRILSHSGTNPDGSKWVETFSYDSQGRVLKRAWNQPDGQINETSYTYDERGRLIGTAGSGQSNESTRFTFDEHGRKTRIVSSTLKLSPTDTKGHVATSVNIENDDLIAPALEGGTVKTLFNERDQPTETRVYDADGQLITRLVRTYDTQGRPAETKMIIDNPESMFPTDIREKILAESGASAAELKEQLTQLLGGPQGMGGISYTYDAQGRVTEKRQHFGAASHERLTKITYNDHGDKIDECTTTSGDLNPREGAQGNVPSSSAPATASAEQSEVRYSYGYDAFGNWTEQKISSRSRPNEPFTVSTIFHRTIAYY
jgi:YD repeat-containing protein